MQMDAMREFAIRRGWTVSDAVAEIGSGATDHRPKRQELLTAARQRKLEVILVWKLDRWGRSLVDLMVTLHELTALGSGLSRSRRRSISRPSRTCFRWLPGGVCGVRTRLDP
jgi:putative DNA-invertase from lambdoid prophage Rac